MPKTKLIRTPTTPELERERRRVLERKYHTIRAFAEALFQLPQYPPDENGRVIGYDYGWIRERILRKFPTVTIEGPHKGQPTKVAWKELQAIVSSLNRNGVKLPFRPRRKIAKKKIRS